MLAQVTESVHAFGQKYKHENLTVHITQIDTLEDFHKLKES